MDGKWKMPLSIEKPERPNTVVPVPQEHHATTVCIVDGILSFLGNEQYQACWSPDLATKCREISRFYAAAKAQHRISRLANPF